MIAELPLTGEAQGRSPLASHRTALENAVADAIKTDLADYINPDDWESIIEELAGDGDASSARDELVFYFDLDAPSSGIALDTAKDHLDCVAYAYWRLDRYERDRLASISKR